MSLSASSVHAAATTALVDAMAGMMFFTTPPVSCQVTPCVLSAGTQWSTFTGGSMFIVADILTRRMSQKH